MAHRESEGAALLKKLIAEPTAIAVDTEGTGLKVADGTDYAIGVSIAAIVDGEAVSHYFPLRHFVGENVSKVTAKLLDKALSRDGHTLIFANVQYDVMSLENVGIHLREKDFIDICTMAHFVNENFPRNKGVDSLAHHYLQDPGKVVDSFVETEKKTGNRNITPEQMWDYAVVDAELTYRIWLELARHPHWTSLPADIWPAKQDLIRTLIAMRRRGVKLDVDLAQVMAERGQREMARIRKELGYATIGPKALEELFIGKLGLPVVKLTPGKKPSFDKEAMGLYDAMLERMGGDSPEAKLVKEYRGWQKTTTATYEPYLRYVDSDGRLRCSYTTHVVTTGRLSCREPNLQQIPKTSDKPWNGKVKECFIAEPGFVLLNADFSQLELRLGTAYSGEPSLREVFADPERDIFTEMAAGLGMTRQDTKTFVYSTQYGAGRTRLVNVFGVTDIEAQKMLNNYYATYPHFRSFNERCKMKVEREKVIRMWTGRERHFQYAKEGYKAMNSVIQGGAADIVERVMVRAFRELESDDCHMLLQVHDSLTFEVRIEKVDEYLPKIKALMEDVNGIAGDIEFDVTFAVDAGFWSARDEAIYQEWKEQAA